ELADGWLNYQRLELSVYTDNLAAMHLYRKFEFAIEGTCRAYAFRDGGYVDAYQMARMHPALKMDEVVADELSSDGKAQRFQPRTAAQPNAARRDRRLARYGGFGADAAHA